MRIENRSPADYGGIVGSLGTNGVDPPPFCPPDLRRLAPPPPWGIARALMLILHRGFVDCRNLAHDMRCEQIAGLSDTMEFLPQYLDHWVEGDLEVILKALRDYESRYECRGYSKYLCGTPVPDHLN